LAGKSLAKYVVLCMRAGRHALGHAVAAVSHLVRHAGTFRSFHDLFLDRLQSCNQDATGIHPHFQRQIANQGAFKLLIGDAP
jgi:hypothetical protein